MHISFEDRQGGYAIAKLVSINKQFCLICTHKLKEDIKICEETQSCITIIMVKFEVKAIIQMQFYNNQEKEVPIKMNLCD